MGRLFLVDLDLVPGQRTAHLRCRHCYPEQICNVDIIYVALKRNRIHEDVLDAGTYFMYTHTLDHQDILAGNYRPVHFYTEVANVSFDKPVVTIFYGKSRGVMAHMHCNKCQVHLGWKFIESFKPKYKFLEGAYVFDRTKLHLWYDEEREKGNYIHRELVCL